MGVSGTVNVGTNVPVDPTICEFSSGHVHDAANQVKGKGTYRDDIETITSSREASFFKYSFLLQSKDASFIFQNWNLYFDKDVKIQQAN